MTQAQKDRNWRKLCGGKPAPKPDPLFLKASPEIPLLHPERNSDPRWQWRKFSHPTIIKKLRSWGALDEAKLQAHFNLVRNQNQNQSHDPAVQIRTRQPWPSKRRTGHRLDQRKSEDSPLTVEPAPLPVSQLVTHSPSAAAP